MRIRINQFGVADMIPERNTIGKSAVSVFFEEYNDIDIYIEDTAVGAEKIATKIFSRVFGEKYKVDKIFPLGGRIAVLQQFEVEKNRLHRPSIFVIDGDIFLLAGDTIPNEVGLYRFPFYCIENLLMDGTALNAILDEEDPTQSEEELAEKYSVNQWAENNEAKLLELFVEYAVSNKLNPAEPTISFQVKNLVSSNDGQIDDAKLRARLDDLKQKTINAASESIYHTTRQSILSSFHASNLSPLDVVSGKDYIFPLLKTRFRSLVKTNMTDSNFKLRLAKICDTTRIEDCISRVKNHTA